MAEQDRPINPSRRRLARGAVAAPAVLASITAKNALAGSYYCTTTGVQSGNQSHKHEDSNCYDKGRSCEQWKSRYKGDKRTFVQCMGTDYKGKTEKASGYGRNKTDGKRRRANAYCNEKDWTSATCDEILNGEDHAMYPIHEIDVVLAGLCAFLNAEEFGRDYYVSTADAIGLFQGAIGASIFYKMGKPWTSEECRTHLALLYKPV
jgi:hypothetical protein